jgi:hypothetical protein
MATADSTRSGLSGAEVAVLAAAALVVSVGYGILIPVLPGWLASLESSVSASTIAEKVGELCERLSQAVSARRALASCPGVTP